MQRSVVLHIGSALLAMIVATLPPTTISGQGASGAKRSKARSTHLARPATVEGDVFLRMKSGDSYKGTGVIVRLIADVSKFREDRRALCTVGKAQADWISSNIVLSQRQDSLDKIGPILTEGIMALVENSPQRVKKTGVDGHFRFDSLTPGPYILIAEWHISDQWYLWWIQSSFASGQHVRLDLDHSNVRRNTVIEYDMQPFCPPAYMPLVVPRP